MKRLLIITLCITAVVTGCTTQSAPPPQESIPVVAEAPQTAVPQQEKPEQPVAEQPPVLAPAQEEQKKSVSEKKEVDAAPKLDLSKLTSKRKTSYSHFNTLCFAVVYDDFSAASAMERFESSWQEVQNMLARIENDVSVNISSSDIYKFNQAKYGESVAISSLTAEIVAQAKEMYEFTNGAYNPAVAYLVDLWGFSPRFLNHEDKKMPYDRPQNKDGSIELPDPRYVEAFKTLSDFSAVKLSKSGSGYVLTKNAKDIEIDGVLYSLKIDLGGIAKGYGADQAAELLKKRGYDYGYVNIGLSSMKLLKKDISPKGAQEGNMWAISISNPDTPSEAYMTGFGKDTGVSTSGTYETYYSLNGRKYSHIIDPHTGEPTQSDIQTVSVWGGNAGYADALTTALCVMGSEKADSFMQNKLKNYKVAFITKTGDKLELHTNMDRAEYQLNK